MQKISILFLFFMENRKMRKYFRTWIFLALGCSRALCFDIQHFYCQKCKCGVKWTEWGKHYSDKHPSNYKIPLFLFFPLEKHSRTDGKGGVTFNMGSGVSTMIQAKYFVTDEFFVSLNIHDNISVDIFGKDFTSGKSISKGGQRGIVMLGVGYKFYR